MKPTTSASRSSFSVCLLATLGLMATPPLVAQEPGERRVMVWKTSDRTVELPSRLARRAFLGVSLLDLTPDLRSHFGVAEDRGVMISAVEDDSPAYRAGLEVADIVTEIDGEAIPSVMHLGVAVGRRSAGDEIAIAGWREKRPLSLKATLEEHDRPQFDIAPLVRERIIAPGRHVFRIHTANQDEGRPEGESTEEVVVELEDDFSHPALLVQLEGIRSDRNRLYEQLKLMESRLEELEAEIERLSGGRD